MGKTIESDGLQAQAREVSKEITNILQKASSSHPDYVCNIRGQGTIIAFDCSTPALRDSLAAHLRNNGLLVGTNGTQSMRFRPALTFSMEHVKEFQQVFHQSLEQLSA